MAAEVKASDVLQHVTNCFVGAGEAKPDSETILEILRAQRVGPDDLAEGVAELMRTNRDVSFPLTLEEWDELLDAISEAVADYI